MAISRIIVLLAAAVGSCVFLAGCGSSPEPSPAPINQAVGLQTFSWDDLGDRSAHLASLVHRAAEFGQDGFTHVWMPPPSQSADSQGYLPGEWYNIVGADSLRAVTAALVTAGVRPVCDIVINHRTGSGRNGCDNEYINFTRPDWGPWSVVEHDGKCGADQTYTCSGSCKCGASDTGDNFCAAPDVDHTNSQVQADVIVWLKWLKHEFNFAGWRLDFVKGYAPAYVKQYVEAAGGDFAVGEYFDADASKISSWLTISEQHAFDFPQRLSLKHAFASGDLSHLKMSKDASVAYSKPNAACSFLDNHDTSRPSGQGGGDGGFGADKALELGYAYILTHPSMPWVFLPHLDGATGSTIRSLIKVRQQVQINSSDSVHSDVVSSAEYSAYIGGDGKCTGKLAVRIGSGDWKPCGEGHWEVAASGNQWSVWSSVVVPARTLDHVLEVVA